MLYNKLRTNKVAEILIIGIRFLVGFAFIPSGMTKLLGHRFTSISTENSIGYFFEGLYQSGLYWNFLGFCQVLTAFLLFTQRFAIIGAILFCGLILNIFVITISMDFHLTWVITLLMLIAGIILLLWDWHKIKPIFGFYPSEYEIKNYKSTSLVWQIIGLSAFIGITAMMFLGANL